MADRKFLIAAQDDTLYLYDAGDIKPTQSYTNGLVELVVPRSIKVKINNHEIKFVNLLEEEQ